jgi:hypothetical protein
MPGPDVPRPERTDEQHVHALRVRRERAERVEARRVGPLHVVDEEHERLPLGRERLHERLQRDVEPCACVDRVDSRQRGRNAEDGLELGHELGEDARVVAHGSQDALAPGVSALQGLCLELGDEPAQRLDDGHEGRVRRTTIELPRDEADPPPHLAVQRFDQGALADPGVARDEDQLARTRGHPLDRRPEGRQLRIAPVEPVGQRQ